MSSGAGETSGNLEDVKHLLERITKDCGKISVVKKGTLELANLSIALSNRLSGRSPIPQQSNCDDLIRELAQIEEQLADWSNYNRLTSFMKKKEIEAGVAEFILRLGSIISRYPSIQPTARSSPGGRGRNPSNDKGVKGGTDEGPISVVKSTSHSNHGSISRQISDRETPESHSVEANRTPPVRQLNGQITGLKDIAFTEGTHCDVWIGLWERAGDKGVCKKKVALKALRTPKPVAERARERLERELPNWAGLRHHNILPFYGTITDMGPRLYMVSPWRENGNLLAYVRNNRQSNKNYLLRGSAAGLSHLHSRGIVHGSVKCKNVLVSDKGEPQICDFGIAKIMEESNESTRSKSSQDIVRYSALELIENTKAPATTDSDTYSFAMLILECITEEIPFSNLPSYAGVIHARISKRQTPPRPDGQNRISDDLWDLMIRCWSVTLHQRPTMEQVHTHFLLIPDSTQ